jgi:SAM-dependent methyltransferase
MPQEWWETFFSGMMLDVWRAAISEEMTRADADFLQRALALPAGSRVLDAPCGNGRLTLELAARGFRTTGVDLAAPFVREGREQAAARKLEATVMQGDIRRLSFNREFDGAFCYGNCFGYFTDEGNQEFLASVAKALKPGGKFLLDAASCAETLLRHFEERTWAQFGDILFLEEQRYEPLEGRFVTDYTLVRDGETEKKTGSHRVYTCREVCSMLERAGFEDLSTFGSLEMEPFRLGSPTFLVLAVRRAT